MNKVVDLQRPVQVVDTEGSRQEWETYAASVRAAVEPASQLRVERYVSATIETPPISHLVTIYHRESRATPQADPGQHGLIHTADRVLFRGRALQIISMQNPREDNRTLILACEERDA